MAWDDLSDLEHKLNVALRGFDWEGSDEICRQIMDRLLREEAIFPDKKARSLLQALRRKRRFTSMGLLAEAFLQSGLRTSQVRRQYAQALIDQGMLKGAEEYLRRLLEDPETNDSEQAEAHGLLGRIYKQLYVNEYTKANPARAQRNLQLAFDEYALSYREDPSKNTWHGINIVALLARAERDRIALKGAVDYKQLAQSILDTLSKKEEEEADGLPAWDLATQMEAHVALGAVGEAIAGANNYADAKGTDDFEISSTLRQLIEVWQLKNTDRPGDELIPILRAAQLFQEGGGQTVPLQEARQDLEKVFGGDKPKSLEWYLQGLGRAKSVCRIETGFGEPFGTGWLVKSTDFFPNQPLRPVVLTNAHVVSTTYDKALKPSQAWVNFQMLGVRLQIKSIVWSSPVEELDATFLDLVEVSKVDCVPMQLFPNPLQMAEPGPRMYIIGHPGGRDLEFSLNDNRLIACSDEKLHYRTPTEGGSSGSPIFDPVSWQVVGLHHAGRTNMPKLNGPVGEFYQANEGIAILAIMRKTLTLP